MMYRLFLLIFCLPLSLCAQYTIKGIVLDRQTKESLIGANILIKGTEIGEATNYKGEFKINSPTLPITLVLSYIGYRDKKILVDNQEFIIIHMDYEQSLLGEVLLSENRITKKQKEAALTVESIDLISIEQSTASNFYESLGQLKGVDITSASLGFKIINTRGFNSSSPVRSLQLINGVDNQSPGLNFSLGNFLGVSELDIQRVNVIAGASSAYFGPNAFNGVIEMETKSPFQFKGLDVSQKLADRSLLETAIRFAKVWKNKNKEEKLGLKLNMYYLSANEWKANNFNPTSEAEDGKTNPGGYDAVNIYGDEFINGGDDLLSDLKIKTHPGLGNIYRSGYREVDLVNSDSKNAKINLGLFYRIKPELELSYNFNYGSGSTIYQGDNRYRLDGIRFFQNVIELKQKDKWFFKFYSTKENAGDTYDIFFTALKIQEQQAGGTEWKQAYADNWKEFYVNQVKDLPNYGDYQNGLISYDEFLQSNADTIAYFHEQNRNFTDNFSYNILQTGTAEFDSVFHDITSKSFSDGGTKFVDRSALYHAQGEYNFKLGSLDAKTGMSMRWYRPESEGTIFDERRITTQNNEHDTTFVTIKNQEWGSYFGLEKKWKNDLLKTALVVRLDKNENFDFLFSPAISAVYNLDENHLIRISASAAIRNPTLQDQYLNYNIGTATLKGSLNGYDSLVTIDSFKDFITELDADTLDYFNVNEIKPEKVKTIELGYRGSIKNKWYFDISTFYSYYTDFIGYEIGLDMDLSLGFPKSIEVLRLSSNASSAVQTTGFNFGANHYFNNTFTFMGNYSWNKIVTGKDDPIVPAFNTPEHKFNLSVNARNFSWKKNNANKNWSATLSHKWVEGYNFQGSPQFTGMIDNYSSTDMQISYIYEKWKSTFKFGVSNLLNDEHYEIYGGPLIGRLVYFSVKYHLKEI